MRSKLEFSRTLEAARVPASGSREQLKASPDECIALARRMEVPAIYAFTADLQVTPWRSGGLKITGKVRADMEQISVVSLEAFRSTQAFDVDRYFLPGAPGQDDEVDALDHGAVDLGEVAAETLALELDPYPRKPDEFFAGYDSEETPEKPVSPFAALAKNPKKDM